MDEPSRHESFIELGTLPPAESGRRPARGSQPKPCGPLDGLDRSTLRRQVNILTALLLALTLATGSTPWPLPIPPQRPRLLAGEPLLLGSLITEQSPGGFGVAAYRVRDGKSVWRLPFDRGFVERLAVVGETLVVGAFRADSPEPDGERLVLGVDADSGKVKWSWPGLLLAQDGLVAAVIDRAAGQIWGFHAQTGDLRWRLPVDGQDAVTTARFPQRTEELLVSKPDGAALLVELATGAARATPGLPEGELPVWLDRGLLMTGRPDAVGGGRSYHYSFFEARAMARLWETVADAAQPPEPCRPHICLTIGDALRVHTRATGQLRWASRIEEAARPALDRARQLAVERDALAAGGQPPNVLAGRRAGSAAGWQVVGAVDGRLLVIASGSLTSDGGPWLGTVDFPEPAGAPVFGPLLRLASTLDGFAAGRPDLRGAWLLCPAGICSVPVRLTAAELT
jgi:outer membrane protein assembly factor BamB